MDFLKDRRTLLALAGAAVALLAGLGLAWLMVERHRGETASPPPASQGGLVIDNASAGEPHADPARPLRCFVGGQPVGDMTLAECAKRNGVATDALDVGLDQSGRLAAAGQAGAVLTPLPPTTANVPEASAPQPQQGAQPQPLAVSGPAATCMRYSEAQWRRLPADMALGACVQALFAGRCERPGGATYGRWGQQTLRLVPGKVEVSADNHSFKPLMDQPGCANPTAG
jgi:hypothetical protein